MGFEEYKLLMQEEYDLINSINIIEFEMPNDIELLKMYFSGKVFAENQDSDVHKQLAFDGEDDDEIDWDWLINRD